MKPEANKTVSQADTTVRVILYKSKTYANGEHPIMLCVTQNRKRKYISLGLSCNPKLWSKSKNEPTGSHPQKDEIVDIIAKKLSEYSTAIVNFKRDEKEFTSTTLVKHVEEPNAKSKKITLYEYFKRMIERLEAAERMKYAMSFKDTLRVLKLFQKDDLPFGDVDVKFCNNFETYLRKKKLKETTISVYFRTLRVVFNEAIKEKATKLSNYPFKEYKVSKFNLKTRKRAITKDDKNAIAALSIAETSRIYRSRQFFLFSYYVRGINFIDIANLRWSNIEKDRLYYVRSKTDQTFNIKLLPQAQAIIDHWKPVTYTGDKEGFIFPILHRDRHSKPQQVLNRLHKILGQTNLDLKLIGDMVGLEIPLTMYVARHAYATILKHEGVSTSAISEAMGHQTEAITKTYLKAFENEVVDEADKNL